jgi:hypothetical protein
MYPSEIVEHPPERLVADRVTQQDFRSVLQNPPSPFKTSPIKSQKRTSRVQYDASVKDLDRIKKHLRRPGMSASDIGRMTFDHYLKTECPE